MRRGPQVVCGLQPREIVWKETKQAELSIEEQIDYVQSLWDRIAATPGQVPVPEWHQAILAERLKDYDATPDAGESWDVVRKRLRAKLREP